MVWIMPLFAVISVILSEKIDLVLGFETISQYDPIEDLGKRYGKRDDGTIDDLATTNFIRYWEAGCRYILSALSQDSGFRKDVDVWGIPHLINNAIGSALRFKDKCPKCNSPLWLLTDVITLEVTFSSNKISLPLFPICCFNCDWCSVVSSNI